MLAATDVGNQSFSSPAAILRRGREVWWVLDARTYVQLEAGYGDCDSPPPIPTCLPVLGSLGPNYALRPGTPLAHYRRHPGRFSEGHSVSCGYWQSRRISDGGDNERRSCAASHDKYAPSVTLRRPKAYHFLFLPPSRTRSTFRTVSQSYSRLVPVKYLENACPRDFEFVRIIMLLPPIISGIVAVFAVVLQSNAAPLEKRNLQPVITSDVRDNIVTVHNSF